MKTINLRVLRTQILACVLLLFAVTCVSADDFMALKGGGGSGGGGGGGGGGPTTVDWTMITNIPSWIVNFPAGIGTLDSNGQQTLDQVLLTHPHYVIPSVAQPGDCDNPGELIGQNVTGNPSFSGCVQGAGATPVPFGQLNDAYAYVCGDSGCIDSAGNDTILLAGQDVTSVVTCANGTPDSCTIRSGIFRHATNCLTGVTTAYPGQMCQDADDGKLWVCTTPAGGGSSSTLCDNSADWTAVTASAGPATILSDATNCLTNVTTAVAGQLCQDLDDGRLWNCSTPSAGGSSSTLCDTSADWTAVAVSTAGTKVWPISIGSGFADGVFCTGPTQAAINTSKPIATYMVCADNDSSDMQFDFPMPDNYTGGTVQIRYYVYSTTAQSGNISFMAYGTCVNDGEQVPNVSVTGAVTTTFAMGNQTNDEQNATSTALTLNGTCTAHSHVYLAIDVVASTTTIPTMANVRIFSPELLYPVN